ncbi:MAG: VOC family protein [Chloroflexi bacterium]|nr:VOC family protein [Chloroflexota bacterium]
MAFTKIHHVGIVSPDFKTATDVLVDIMGFKVDERRSPLPKGRHVAWDNVEILDIPVGESELEINVANDPETGTGRFLASRGKPCAVHHICFYSTDLEKDCEYLRSKGMQQLGQLAPRTPGKSRAAFFHPKSFMGILLELWENVPAQGIASF